MQNVREMVLCGLNLLNVKYLYSILAQYQWSMSNYGQDVYLENISFGYKQTWFLSQLRVDVMSRFINGNISPDLALVLTNG